MELSKTATEAPRSITPRTDARRNERDSSGERKFESSLLQPLSGRPTAVRRRRTLAVTRFLYRAYRYRFRVEAAEIAFARRTIKRGQTCVDVGGHKGAFSYWMLQRVGHSGLVYSFEPQPELAKYLSEIRDALRLDQLQIVNAAASLERGSFQLFREANCPSPGASLVPTNQDGLWSFPVSTISLDEYFADRSGPISFIKCDVEGHELDVFRGAESILIEDRPTLLFECEQRHLSIRSIDDVFEYLQLLGYAGYFIRRGFLIDIEQFDGDKNRFGTRGYVNNFVFRPLPGPAPPKYFPVASKPA